MTEHERETLAAAQQAHLDYEAGLGEPDDYEEHVHRVALVFGIPVPEAYPLIEEGPRV